VGELSLQVGELFLEGGLILLKLLRKRGVVPSGSGAVPIGERSVLIGDGIVPIGGGVFL
jgi:hypothetical protein